jgi:hypothetical protein
MHRSWWPYYVVLQNRAPQNRAAGALVLVTLLVGALSLTVGCGETDPDIHSGVTSSPDTSGGSAGGLDSGSDSGSDVGLSPTDSSQTPGTCEGAHEDLGILATAESTVVSRTLEPLDAEPMSCTPDGERRGGYIFAFEVDETAILQMSVSATTTDLLSFGLFDDGCGSDAESYCSGQSPWRAIVEPDTTYYMNVQGGEDSVNKAFNASFGFEETVCTPGETTCSDSTSKRCVQGTSVEPYSCAGDCSDAQSCAGDTCQTALSVAPIVGGGPVSIQGDRWAYTHQWNAAELSGCEVSAEIATGETTAMELFVDVANLEAGQTLEIGHPDGVGSYLYFVIDDCAATSCREAAFVDEAGDNRLVWQVADDGDYTIVVEALSTTSRPFELDFLLR